MIWFLSDPHLGHDNVIEYSNRPFSNVDEMDDHIIKRCQASVKRGDTLYCLGDFSLADDAKTVEYINRLPKMHLILGNHDSRIRKKKVLRDMFLSVQDYLEIKVPDTFARGGKRRITLCHYAMESWASSHFGAWSLHGHHHGMLPDNPDKLRLDVGVDANGCDYGPISYDQVKNAMMSKSVYWKYSTGNSYEEIQL